MEYTLEKILEILKNRGHEQYGKEAVSQLEHALQCATLAQNAGSSPELITASLLHDFGHLIHDLGEDSDRDDRHEYRAIPPLKQLFAEAVTEPIRLHVKAKRYLCATQPQYRENLSPASQLSLELQGGIFSTEEAIAFMGQPHAEEAVKLRLWDDSAKVVNCKTPNLDEFIPVLQWCLKST